MTPDDKPAHLTPRNIGLAILLALAVVAVVAVFMLSPVSAMKTDEAQADVCKDAAEWHYSQAIKATPEAEYHFWAGAAAEKLAATGGTCSDWGA